MFPGASGKLSSYKEPHESLNFNKAYPFSEGKALKVRSHADPDGRKTRVQQVAKPTGLPAHGVASRAQCSGGFPFIEWLGKSCLVRILAAKLPYTCQAQAF